MKMRAKNSSLNKSVLEIAKLNNAHMHKAYGVQLRKRDLVRIESKQERRVNESES